MKAQLIYHKITDREPPQNKVIMTKIVDENGAVRNEQPLVRKGRFWWLPDMSMYVYFTPTHWAKKI